MLLTGVIERLEAGQSFIELAAALAPFDGLAERRTAQQLKRTEIMRQ